MAARAPVLRLPGGGGTMPLLGLGTSTSNGEGLRAALRAALACGYRHVDTATMYGNEEAVGEALREWLDGGEAARREELFVTTKLPPTGNRAESVEKFLKASLEKLKVSYVDLYLFHIPVGVEDKGKYDNSVSHQHSHRILDMDTDIENVWRALEDQVDAGRTRAIGLSNFNSVQIERILKICRIRPAVHQMEVHAYHQQKELRAFTLGRGIPVCAYAPIGSPDRDPKRKERPPLLQHPEVRSVAKRLRRTPAQVLIRFLIQMGVAVIPKSSSPERIRQNIQVFDFELNEEEMSCLEALDYGKEGKIFTFEYFDKHPEYPFHIPY